MRALVVKYIYFFLIYVLIHSPGRWNWLGFVLICVALDVIEEGPASLQWVAVTFSSLWT